MGSTKPDEGIPPKANAIMGTTSVPKPLIPVFDMPIITAQSMEISQRVMDIENLRFTI